MDKYKRAIEAIVAPLEGDERQKNNLRRELWQHFCSLAEEEQQRGQALEVACANALYRLGTPEEIKVAFDHAQSPFVPFFLKLERRLRRQPEESAGHHFMRFSRWFPFIQIAPFIMIAAIGYFSRGVKSETLVMLGVTWATFSTWLWLWIFLILSEIPAMERLANLRERGLPVGLRLLGGFLRQAVWGFVLAALFFLGGCLVIGMLLDPHIDTIVILGQHAQQGIGALLSTFHVEALVYVYVAPWLFAFMWMVHAILLPIILLRDARYAQPIPDWPYSAQ